MSLCISTDKACYAPGSTACFTSEGILPDGARVRYRHLGKIVADYPLKTNKWEWTVPNVDFQGYMIEVYTSDANGHQIIHGVIALDVSSSWKRFPRYGFVATFNDAKNSTMEKDMEWLNRCHINGVQFQDWHYSHHHPCPMIVDGQPLEEFTDIAMRKNKTSVIKRYIATQHSYGMKSIFYNLGFGALCEAMEDNARDDQIEGLLKNGYHQYNGVSPDWLLYKDDKCREADKHDLPQGWKSDIYLVNPGLEDWINYMNLRNEDVYSHFDFDGFQIDQLGHRGNLYGAAAHGNPIINLAAQYAKFINGMYAQRPDKELIMNSVSRFGSKEILQTGHMAFAYNETWGDDDNDGYDDLYDIIHENQSWGGANMQTVFAAYMNYNYDGTKGKDTFNTPGVLQTDAVIFALGGSHLELGDHMLCHEYFPFEGVGMSDSLKNSIINYYDFLVGYENILRGGEERPYKISLGKGKLLAWDTLDNWKPETGKICSYGKKVDGLNVVHLLNFTDANSISWRDVDGTMPEPSEITGIPITVHLTEHVSSVWTASPDYHGGALQELEFTQTDDDISFTLPALKYWSMIVFDTNK